MDARTWRHLPAHRDGADLEEPPGCARAIARGRLQVSFSRLAGGGRRSGAPVGARRPADFINGKKILVYAAESFGREELQHFSRGIVAQAIAHQVEMQAHILFAYTQAA